ncbi:hypothetical protein SCOR_00405 [Sulfidibacter corallicola]|uniref:Uncharacterized protein n=1 Tax=Sulfidibacter corallicola TaxID=2818388 RepID=A0A8A4TR66_SULCO|nr:hypothetical protein [Sulfidibacter corallicola]QTD49015.1 hypothetical protein J3U87_25805 [Sulfidibacter corallicola]
MTEALVIATLSFQVFFVCLSPFPRFHVTLVYVESLYERQATQNKNRDHVVPDRVIGRMREQWSVPDPFEAHDVIFEVSGGA